MYNCYSLEDKILHIARCEYNYFLSKPNVVGVGLGYKIKNGFNTLKKCLSVFVANKIPSCYLLDNDKIPSCYNGIPTDVVNTGAFRLLKLTPKVRPVTGGYDIGPALFSDSGTLGCVVTDTHNNYLLTNNHTITLDETLPLNYSITQPSDVYHGKYPEDTIATLSKYIPINYSTATHQGINHVDCAIAKITEPSEVSTKITFIGNIRGITKPSLGLRVKKVGATSELTKGNITSIGATIEFDEPKGKSVFLDQIITSKTADSGDYGTVYKCYYGNARK
ncbi:S1 family peptidase [Clostridium botulinum]|uniref:S1 family peptidase n=1 Tax=Clostridium botulinum TaxID=1491 RepID=UPI000AAEB60A|nr:S1 family peptidase [Clostridium botulinum]